MSEEEAEKNGGYKMGISKSGCSRSITKSDLDAERVLKEWGYL